MANAPPPQIPWLNQVTSRIPDGTLTWEPGEGDARGRKQRLPHEPRFMRPMLEGTIVGAAAVPALAS